MEDEVGDLFFVLVNIARYLSLDPESALKKTNRKFKRRFQWMEDRLRASESRPAAGVHGRTGRTMATGEAAGKTAVTTATTDSLAIRKCEALEEMQACFALQKEVWKFSDAELVPVRIFVLATKIGGHVIGAFDGRELIGFALAIPGMRSGHSICIRTCWLFASSIATPGSAGA